MTILYCQAFSMRKSQRRVKRVKRRVKRYGMPLRGMDWMRRRDPPLPQGKQLPGLRHACLPNGGGVAKRRWGFPLSAFGHFPLWGKQGLPRAKNSEFRTPNSELHCRPSEQNRDGTLIRTIPVFLSKKRKAENCAHATSHLYFSTLYSGTKGSRMGTVLTYF